MYAVTAMLLGRMEDYFAIRERAYDELLQRGDLLGAAGAALWSGMQRMFDGHGACAKTRRSEPSRTKR